MPNVILRSQMGNSQSSDLTVRVMDNTFEYLMTSSAPTIKVSAYLDQDLPRVEKTYAELFVAEDCPFLTAITKVTPGSRVRKNIQLPGEMKAGEQLILEVSRQPKDASNS